MRLAPVPLAGVTAKAPAKDRGLLLGALRRHRVGKGGSPSAAWSQLDAPVYPAVRAAGMRLWGNCERLAGLSGADSRRARCHALARFRYPGHSSFDWSGNPATSQATQVRWFHALAMNGLPQPSQRVASVMVSA